MPTTHASRATTNTDNCKTAMRTRLRAQRNSTGRAGLRTSPNRAYGMLTVSSRTPPPMDAAKECHLLRTTRPRSVPAMRQKARPSSSRSSLTKTQLEQNSLRMSTQKLSLNYGLLLMDPMSDRKAEALQGAGPRRSAKCHI